MPKMIFVNLPVKDLAASIRFYKAIGCTQNEAFSTEDAAMMVWSDAISFMLLTHNYFSTFTPRTIADAEQVTEVLLAISSDSREAVDALARAVGEAGGKVDIRPPQEMGFMYGRAFADPDGHIIETAWMDVEAATGQPG